jgi:hypothetical protein
MPDLNIIIIQNIKEVKTNIKNNEEINLSKPFVNKIINHSGIIIQENKKVFQLFQK